MLRLRTFWIESVVLAGMLLAGCGVALDSTSTDKTHTLPPAEDRPEPDAAVSGRVPITQQLTLDTTLGYRKGLRLVGQNAILYPGSDLPRGMNFQLGWVGDCAYVGTADLTQYVAHRYYMTPLIATQADSGTGMAVIDAADPINPELVQIIPNPEIVTDTENPGDIPAELMPDPNNPLSPPNTHRAMAMNWFAITSHEGRRIVVAGAHTLMGIFDATDCRNPVLKSLVDLHHLNVAVHGLRLSKDGMRVYVSGVLTFDAMAVLDIADLSKPKILKSWPRGAHDVEINDDETRMYMNSLTLPGTADGGGLRVVDITGIRECGGGGHGGHDAQQAGGEECPVEFKEISHYIWTGLSHATRVGRVKGRLYAFTVDEYSSDLAGTALCTPGWVRVIDLSNEQDPQRVADIKLGVSKPENCRAAAQDSVTYNSHYLELDNKDDTRLVFISWYASGMRVFDVSDPEEPKEIAYLIPPAIPEAVYQSAFGKPLADSTISHVRWRPELGHLWVVNVNGGFSILQFTQSALLPPGYLP